jgi:Toxin SymE, type I toxin-antitoxin system
MAIEDCTPAPPAIPELSISLNPPPPETFAPHRMTVSYTGPGTPYLRLRGHWLERAGFPVGTPVACRGIGTTPDCAGGGARRTPSLCRA